MAIKSGSGNENEILSWQEIALLELKVGETYITNLGFAPVGSNERMLQRLGQLEETAAFEFLFNTNLISTLTAIDKNGAAPLLTFKPWFGNGVLTIPLTRRCLGKIMRGDGIAPVDRFSILPLTDLAPEPTERLIEGAPFFWAEGEAPAGFVSKPGSIAEITLFEPRWFSHCVRKLGLHCFKPIRESHLPGWTLLNSIRGNISPELAAWWPVFTDLAVVKA